MDDAKLLELIPEYALGALEGEEKAAVEALLQRSTEAQRLFAEYDELLVNALLLSTPLQTAPSHMTEDFASRLRAETDAAPPLKVLPPKPSTRPALILLAAAILLMVIGLGILIRSGIIFNNLIPTVDIAQIEINQIINHTAAQRIAVNFPNDPGVSGTLVYVGAENRAVLEVQRLQALPSAQAYEVWLINASAPPLASGVFNTSRTEDTTRYLIRANVPITSYETVALTIEKSTGSDKPTSAPIASGTIPRPAN